MKCKAVIFGALALVLSLPTLAADGCEYKGQSLLAGTVVNVDMDNPLTKQSHREFIETHGVKPDGGAYKQAICSVLVDVLKNDVEDQKDRVFVWVQVVHPVGSGYIDKSYNDLALKI